MKYVILTLSLFILGGISYGQCVGQTGGSPDIVGFSGIACIGDSVTVCYQTPTTNHMQDPESITINGNLVPGVRFDTMSNRATFLVPPSLIPGLNYDIELWGNNNGGGGSRGSQTIPIYYSGGSLSYAPNSFCASDSTDTFIPNWPGGDFTHSNTNPACVTVTGVIDPTACAPGSFTITYTNNSTNIPCPGTRTINVDVRTNGPVPNYQPVTLCADGNPVLPLSPAPNTGTFTARPSGLDINSATGEIDPSNSTPRTYYISYQGTNDPCPSPGEDAVAIQQVISTFSYGSTSFCLRTANPYPTPQTTGGAYSSSDPINCRVDGQTGAIDLSNSVAGNYTITYIVNTANCNSQSPLNITLTSPPDPVFTYLDDTQYPARTDTFCQGEGTKSLGTFPTVLGSYSSNSSSLPLTIGSGEINLSNAIPGPYEITFTPVDACIAPYTRSILILPTEDPVFDYPGTPYCNRESNPWPNPSPNSNGLFTIRPILTTDTLNIDSLSGEIFLDSVATGTHEVTYTTTGLCPETHQDVLVVIAQPEAAFGYNRRTQFCTTEGLIQTDTTYPAGSWSFIPLSDSSDVLSLDNLGGINPSLSDSGTYTIIHQVSTAGGACPNTSSLEITIYEAGSITITYDSSTFCSQRGIIQPIITPPDLDHIIYSDTNMNSGKLVFLDEPDGATRISPSLNGYLNPEASDSGTFGIIIFVDDFACPITDTFTIEIIEAPQSHFEYFKDHICKYPGGLTPVDLLDDSSGIFSDTLGLVHFLDKEQGIIDLDSSEVGQASLMHVTDLSGCRDTSFQTVFIEAIPVPAPDPIDPIDSLCVGEESTICLTGQIGDTVMYHWMDSLYRYPVTGIGSPQKCHKDTLPLGENTVTLWLVNSYGCAGSVDKTMRVFTTPEVYVLDSSNNGPNGGLIKATNFRRTFSSEHPEDIDILIESSLPGASINWWAEVPEEIKLIPDSGGIDLEPSSRIGRINNFLSADLRTGIQCFKIFFQPTLNNCVGPLDSAEICILSGNDLFIPELITPNADGVNDTWKISYTDNIIPSEHVIQVFNRDGGLFQQLNSLAEREELRLDLMADGVYWWTRRRMGDAEIETGVLVIARD